MSDPLKEISTIEGVHHSNITVSDLDRALAFYKDVLGLTFLYKLKTTSSGVGLEGANRWIAVLKAGDDIVELIQYVAPRGRPYNMRICDAGCNHLAFRVSDIYRAYDELRKKGVKFKSAPNEVAKGPMKGWKWVFFNDPDGINLELVEQGSK